MNILIVGNGGREHALLWKLRKDAPDATFHATRPNAGMAPWVRPVDLSPEDVDGLASWADGEGIDLTVVGPEAPLAAGIVNRFRERGLRIFGPDAEAARIEASKAFAKDVMRSAGVPTAAYAAFTDAGDAEAYIREAGAPLVVKASGLASGKGAVVCQTEEEALAAAEGMLQEGAFGDAGRTVVVEELMEGEELSVFAVTDGRHAATFVPSQDHKAVGEGDRGPNTGGMGAYAPVSVATPDLVEQVRTEILHPTLLALDAMGCRFRGLLYAGLMLTEEGPKVVEFNCRFGDPEAQVILPLLSDSLLDLLVPVAAGASLADEDLGRGSGAALTTVLASEGYPGPYEKGRPMTLPEEEGEGRILFHAGTERDPEGTVRTAGGRVLAATGLGPTLEEARERSLELARAVDFQGKYFRGDIGWRELKRS